MNQVDVLSTRLAMSRFSSPTHRIAGYDLARRHFAFLRHIFCRRRFSWVNQFERDPFEKLLRWISK
jgi:hypothetical protein